MEHSRPAVKSSSSQQSRLKCSVVVVCELARLHRGSRPEGCVENICCMSLLTANVKVSTSDSSSSSDLFLDSTSKRRMMKLWMCRRMSGSSGFCRPHLVPLMDVCHLLMKNFKSHIVREPLEKSPAAFIEHFIASLLQLVNHIGENIRDEFFKLFKIPNDVRIVARPSREALQKPYRNATMCARDACPFSGIRHIQAPCTSCRISQTLVVHASGTHKWPCDEDGRRHLMRRVPLRLHVLGRVRRAKIDIVAGLAVLRSRLVAHHAPLDNANVLVTLLRVNKSQRRQLGQVDDAGLGRRMGHLGVVFLS